MISLHNLLSVTLASEDVTALLAASYKDFHAKGLNYLCLKRSPQHTVKIYTFDGDVRALPEVVNPHDHRYRFKTTVVVGGLADYRFERVDEGGEVFQAFDYLTPLNGGNGFTYRGDERLRQSEATVIKPMGVLETGADHLHTIRTAAGQTILLLEQFEDTVPVDQATSCWVRKGHPEPNTSGLYGQFEEGEFRDWLTYLYHITRSERVRVG